MAPSISRGDRDYPDHPENDLSDDADYANLLPPTPSSAEELAESEDPVRRAERNRASTRQALWYLAVILVGTFLTGGLLAVLARALGGPLCTPDGADWLCSEASQTWWPIAASVTPIAGLIGCGVIMVRKLKSYLRWRPWMGVFWVLVPFTMWWLTYTLGILASN